MLRHGPLDDSYRSDRTAPIGSDERVRAQSGRAERVDPSQPKLFVTEVAEAGRSDGGKERLGRLSWPMMQYTRNGEFSLVAIRRITLTLAAYTPAV